MLDHYFRRASSVAELRSGPFGQVVEEFAVYLHERGYAFEVARAYLHKADRATRWLAVKGLAPKDLDEKRCQAFLRTRDGRLRPRYSHVGVRCFLQMLRGKGIAPTPPAKPLTRVEKLIAEYDVYLRDVAGLAPASRVSRTRFAREFLQSVFGNRAIHTERLSPRHVHEFVARFGRAGCFASVPVAASSLRRFIRWLQIQDRCSSDLIHTVPSFRSHRHKSLPRVLTDRQVDVLLQTFDRTTPVGLRDYAMVLCQLDLGMRCCEVAALELEDIDWRNATIRVVAGKSRRGRLLPLSKGVGQAIAEYLRGGRPSTACRSVFVRHTMPVGTAATCKVVRGAVRRAFAKVEGCEKWTGTHPLRHTAATRMYRSGASLKQVADVLGHHCLDTTAIYTKLNLEQLSEVALPWPKGGDHE